MTNNNNIFQNSSNFGKLLRRIPPKVTYAWYLFTTVFRTLH